MAKIKKYLLIILVLAAIFVGVVFSLSNEDAVQLDLIVIKTPPVDVSLLVISAFGVGLILGMMVTGLAFLKRKVVGPKAKAPKSGQSLATNS
ncbi:lipopolysaccharide assembly protein LapA domain-containing protein [Hahella ganghwensis]|uniref:lipopolysaccharide assembly protein LapA domain-containing protein n=1 Tax=Hahella ganghwensis TaxID=286420 RepID=UPI0003677A95|nr:lipopolysaccharide assembly protein LapA domain-containing protein [Hahella ganghwensis]